MDKRAAFEAWRAERYAHTTSWCNELGEYLDEFTQGQWKAWKGALAAQPAASAEPSDDAWLSKFDDLLDAYLDAEKNCKFSARAQARVDLKSHVRIIISRYYVRPAGDAQPVLYTTEFNGHLQTSTHATQAEAETFARNVNALRRMDREACLVIPLYRDAPVAAQKADDGGPTCPICGCPGGRHSGGSTCTGAAITQQRKENE